MRTFLTTLFMICLISTQIFSQWDWLNPAPHGNANNRIAFGSNSNTYTIVGNAGIIMKTTNDGVDWSLQNSGTQTNLYDIFIFNSEGMAVGDGGTILGTTNGGGNWSSVNSGTTTNLTAVTFSSLSNGIITGWNGLILRTTDTGVSWDSVATSTTQRLYGVSFADANNGLVVGDGGVILRTTNGGDSWNLQTSGTVESLYDVSYVSPTTAVASGWGGTIIRTTNGGGSWYSIGFTTYIRWGVAFTDADNGVVVGDWNTITHTTDGGTTWTDPIAPLLGTNFLCIRFFNSTKGVAVGEYGAIFKTSDGGITWEIVTKGMQDPQRPSGYVDREYFYDVQCINSTTAVILRANGVYFTSNNAQTWTSATISGISQYNLNGLHFNDSNTGTVVGNIDGNNVIMKTTNAGVSWVTQSSSPSGDPGKLNAVSFSSADVGLVVGNSGRILRTNNGGQNWIEQLQGSDIYDIHLVDLNIGYAVGRYGSILKTIDGGATWTSQMYTASYRLNGVAFKDANNGIVVGISTVIGVDYGLILRTTDGGTSWTNQILGSPIFLDDVTYTDNNNCYAVGTSVYVQAQRTRGRIFKSQDAGVTWFEQLIPFKSTRILKAISAFDNNSLLAVGFAGMVLGTTNGGGSTSVEEIITDFIPETFILEQNYPNPFNPSTKIRWQSPVGSWQTLKVYDVLGNEVATLVDDFLPTGTYEVEFNGHSDKSANGGQNLSSGIYFYKLQSGSVVQTKKMILLK